VHGLRAHRHRGSNVTTYSDDGLAPGTYYRYRVRAEGSTASSPWSNKVKATAR